MDPDDQDPTSWEVEHPIARLEPRIQFEISGGTEEQWRLRLQRGELELPTGATSELDRCEPAHPKLSRRAAARDYYVSTTWLTSMTTPSCNRRTAAV